jgi:hypothetical protein
MENPFNKNTERDKWAGREHDIKLHDQVQSWGQEVLPLLSDVNAEDLPERLKFFEFLMTSVERGDFDIARLIPEHEVSMVETTRSWYSGQLSTLHSDDRSELIKSRFITWMKLYTAADRV